MKVSTGLRNHQLVVGSVKSALDGLVVRMYGAATEGEVESVIPATADAGIGSAILMGTVTVDGVPGAGVSFEDTASAGVLAKDPSEVWKGTMTNAGYFAFCRICASDDDDLESTTAIRTQLTVGVLPTKEVIVSAKNKGAGEEQRLDQFYVGVPAGE